MDSHKLEDELMEKSLLMKVREKLSSSCATEETLSDYIKEKLSPEEKLAVERHLYGDDCMKCNLLRENLLILMEGEKIKPFHLWNFLNSYHLVPAILTVFLVIMIGSGIYFSRPGKGVYEGYKGIPPQQQILELEFLPTHIVNGKPVFKGVGIKGMNINQDDQIFFRYTLQKKGYLWFFRFDKEQKPELIMKSEGKIDAGIYDLKQGGQVQGYSLQGLSGNQYFLAIYSSEPKSVNDLMPKLNRKDIFMGEGKINPKVFLSDGLNFDYVKIKVD